MVESIFQKKLKPADINRLLAKTKSLGYHLGIEFLEICSNEVKAKMPVQEISRQPFGLLHGGASVTLAETVGSVAAYLTLSDENKAAVGQSVNSNHVRSIRDGWVFASAKSVHIGSRTHVWDVRIIDESSRLISISRLTVAIIDKG